MGLFYKEEHISCYHYTTIATALFKIHNEKKGSIQVVDIDRSVLLFVVKGEIIVNCNEFKNRRVAEGEMCLLLRNSAMYGRVIRDAQIVSCAFVQTIKFCNKYSFEHLANDSLDNDIHYDFTILPIKERIMQMLSLLINTLSDGLGCTHYHELLEQQLFIYLRAYYSKEELVSFFHPLLGRNLDFKDLILSNYKSIDNIASFAEVANMSVSTFNRRFKDVFNEPAHIWMAKRKAERIDMDIAISSKPLLEIAYQYNFSSQAYLTSFCKKHFDKTPLEIRNEQHTECLEFGNSE